MSDNDSASDSDISQGWTFVGSEGTADGSDHDSDIVILQSDGNDDGDGDFGNSLSINNSESLEMKAIANINAESKGSEATSETKVENVALQGASFDLQSETNTSTAQPVEEAEGLKTELERKLNIKVVDSLEAGIFDVNKVEVKEVFVSYELNPVLKEFDAGIQMNVECEKEESKVWLENDEYLLLQKTQVPVESEMEFNKTDPVEISLVTVLPVCQPSTSFSSLDVASALEQSAKTLEEIEFFQEAGNISNDDRNDEDEDDAEDDDESVVRKFHEATLLSSFNNQRLPLDDNQQNREEDEFLPPDADDRCESDISGVADDSDSDLSSLAGLDDLEINAGDVVRTYRHQPNQKFNFCLTLIAATALLFATGIGIGHYIGSTRGSGIHRQQLLHLKTLQDEYFVCLRDTEKLKSKLAETIESATQEKLSAVMAVWKKKYEELVLERAELEYKLNHLQEKVKSQENFEEKYEHSARKIEEVNVEKFSCSMKDQQQKQAPEVLNGVEMESKPKEGEEQKEYKQDYEKHEELNSNAPITGQKQSDALNATNLEKPLDNESSIFSELNARECCHQVNNLVIDLEKKNSEINLLRNNANQLALENSELKTAIQSQRYKLHPGNLNSNNTKLQNDKQENEQDVESFRLFLHQHQEAKASSSEHHDLGKINSQLSGDEKIKSRSGSKQQHSSYPNSFRSSEPTFFRQKSVNNVSRCLKALENITTDNSLHKFISGMSWNDQDMEGKLDSIKSLLMEAFSVCQEFVDMKSLINITQRKLNKLSKDLVNQKQNETFQHHISNVQKLLKHLSNLIEDFVKSMNRLQKDVFTATGKQKFKNSLNSWVKKVLPSLKIIKENLELLGTREWNSDSFSQKQSSNSRESEAHSSVLKPVDEKAKRSFDGTRDHKQTKSSTSHQKYEEFWKRNHFDPDDFLQEGFFEDNQREWHKHQKRLRKISGRIQRLTEEMLLSMDDDDIEDIYEDIEDLADDIEGRELPEQLRTWLTCQMRWWRSRVHRKHRNEDLVKGCGQQLLHWQLRVLCKDKTRKGFRRNECHKFFKAVISSQGQGLDNGRHFVVKNLLSHHGAKKFEMNHSPSMEKENDVKQSVFDDSHKENNSCALDVGNETYNDRSAYIFHSWLNQFEHPDLGIKPNFPLNQCIYSQHFQETVGNEHKRKSGKPLHCSRNEEFNKYEHGYEPWCEK